MKNNIKKALVTIFCTIALFLSGLTLPNWSIATGVDLVFKKETLSANLNEVSLKVVLEKISREKGIWIKGKGSVLEGKVSLQFRDLSLHDGLKRILAQIDHSFIFDSGSRLIGLYIIGKGNPQTTRTLTTKSGAAMPAADKHATAESSFKLDKSGLLHDGPIEISEEELKGLKVVKNCPPPGGPVEISARELESLKIVRNCPPPGGPIRVSPEELESLKVIKNCSPPGGPVEASAEELESLMVVKSSPPVEDSPVKITKRTLGTTNFKVKRNMSHRWR